MPLSILGERLGLRLSYLIGLLGGITAAILCLLAMRFWSYPLLCVALIFQGTQSATTALLRFGVRAIAPESRRSLALSIVVSGASAASVIGPQMVRGTQNLVPEYRYLGIYIVILGMLAAMAGALLLVRFPPDARKGVTADPRTPDGYDISEVPRWVLIRSFFRHKPILIAAIAGLASWVIMVLAMMPAPLAILNTGHSFDDQVNVMMYHTLGMFAPALMAGPLIDRFGAMEIII
ncbi:hypothetical protein HDU93_003649, partial [Gonapodya sp. JEL0774]